MKLEELKEMVKEGYVKVKFIKKMDGKEKTMIGTTKHEVLVENNSVPTGEASERKPDPENIIRLYCPAEPGGWRSVDFDTIIEFSKSSEEEVNEQIAENKRLYELKMEKIQKFIKTLTENKCEVVYNKKNGHVFEIFTLNPEIVPEDDKPSKSSTTIRVYSLEKDKYISLKWDDIVGYKIF